MKHACFVNAVPNEGLDDLKTNANKPRSRLAQVPVGRSNIAALALAHNQKFETNETTTSATATMRFAVLAATSLFSVATAERTPDPRCGEITQCYLVNLDESGRDNVFHPIGTPIGSSVVSYRPDSSHEGWSIYCDHVGKVNYVKYYYGDGEVNTHYSVPWWANGDNSGQRVNKWGFLEQCGLKTIEVVSFTWDGTDQFPCNSVTLEVDAKCGNPVPAPTEAPVPSPTDAPVPSPTEAPVPSPTDVPVPSPTEAPVPSPTDAPVPAPTDAPVPSPTKAPVPAPTKAPVPAPTRAPVPAPTKPPTSISTCPNDCVVFEGSVDYKVIGNSMSYSEDRRDCRKKSSSSSQLNVPHGAKIEKVYLQWSGSGQVDSAVYLNGSYVRAAKTFNQHLYSLDFFGAYADVTHLVRGSGTYRVSGLSWSNAHGVCQANAAYGAWSLVVVYSGANAVPGTRVHVCQDKFRMTFPQGTYSSSIGCVDASYSCNTNAELTLVTFEGDAYKGEYFYVGGQYFGNNLFRGTTAPNLDINTFNLGNSIVTGGSRSLSYNFKTYYVNSVFGGAVEGLFDFVKVLKYRSDCRW